jgi:hypothetical protein
MPIHPCLNIPSIKASNYSDFKKKISSGQNHTTKTPKQILETNAQDCFRVDRKLLFRRTLEGRVQRALVLYEQGAHQ